MPVPSRSAAGFGEVARPVCCLVRPRARNIRLVRRRATGRSARSGPRRRNRRDRSGRRPRKGRIRLIDQDDRREHRARNRPRRRRLWSRSSGLRRPGRIRPGRGLRGQRSGGGRCRLPGGGPDLDGRGNRGVGVEVGRSRLLCGGNHGWVDLDPDRADAHDRGDADATLHLRWCHAHFRRSRGDR